MDVKNGLVLNLFNTWINLLRLDTILNFVIDFIFERSCSNNFNRFWTTFNFYAKE